MERYKDVTGGQADLADMVKGNPLPLALMGVGLGWLMVNGMRRKQTGGASSYGEGTEGLGYGAPEPGGYVGSSRYTEYRSGGQYGPEAGRAPEAAARERVAAGAKQVAERASEYSHRIQERAQEVAGSARRSVDSMSRAVRHQASDLATRSASTFQDHPLMVGSMALLVGAAIGASLPRTRGEDEVLGRTSDEAMRQARDAGSEAWQRAKQVAARTAEAARESGEQAFERVRDTARESAQEAYGQKPGDETGREEPGEPSGRIH